MFSKQCIQSRVGINSTMYPLFPPLLVYRVITSCISCSLSKPITLQLNSAPGPISLPTRVTNSYSSTQRMGMSCSTSNLQQKGLSIWRSLPEGISWKDSRVLLMHLKMEPRWQTMSLKRSEALEHLDPFNSMSEQSIINIMSQDNILKEAVMIQTLVEEQAARNLETVAGLSRYSLSLTTALQTFVDTLEEGLDEYIDDDKEDSQEIGRMQTYLGKIARELIRVSKQVKESLTISVIDDLRPYLVNLQKQNHRLQEQLCNHYKDMTVGYKMIDLNSDPEDMFNPIYKERDVLQKAREKYRTTLLEFDSVNSDYLQYTKIHLKMTIRSVNELLNLDGVEKYISIPDFMKPLQPESILSDLITDIEQHLGRSHLLHPPKPEPKLTFNETSISNFVTHLVSQNAAEYKDFQEIRSVILGDQKHSSFFLRQLSERLRSDIVMSSEKYHDIQSIVKFILASMMELQEISFEKMVSILRVAIRIRSGGRLLIKELKNYKGFWEEESLWSKMFQEINQSKQDTGTIRHYIKKMRKLYKFKWLKRRNSYLAPVNTQEVVLEIIREISMYLAALELDNEFVIEVLIRLCKQERIVRTEIERLIKYQHSSKKEQLNKKYLSFAETKAQKDYNAIQINAQRLISVIKLSLKFLPLEENCMRLRLVSKRWDQDLTKPLQERYLLCEDNPLLLQKYRLPLYLIICKVTNFTPKDYQALESQISSNFSYRQIINLDVKRSLKWNPSLQPILSSILSTFAYMYPDTGYLQGMNYVVEHLLRLTTQHNQVYKIFEFIMRGHYRNYFENSFDLLRIRIYQLVRLIEIQMPDLARHFEREKVEGEYFLLAWGITLWGEYDGQLPWVMSDGFILNGWVWWMKVCVWVFKVRRSQFVSMKFQDIMKFFSELLSNQFLNGKVSGEDERVRREINELCITPQLLQKIEKEYTHSNQKIDQLLDERK